MVKIINGEIVADDDPRLQQRQQQQQQQAPPRRPPPGPHASGAPFARGAPRPPPRAAAAAGGGFSLDAPPLRMQPAADGGPLPDFEFFGLRVPGLHLALLAGGAALMGWRGLMLGALIGGWPIVAAVLVGSVQPACHSLEPSTTLSNPT
jgi:hypothetical protein